VRINFKVLISSEIIVRADFKVFISYYY